MYQPQLIEMPRADRFTVSPSDLVFLWDECRRCFYRKVIDGVQRLRMPFPKLFTTIDTLMKDRLDGRRTEEIAPTMPSGALSYGEKWVESRPLRVAGARATVVFRGRFDVAAAFDKRTYGVVDFRAAERRAHHTPLYARHLHGYAWALEQPALGRFGLSPVATLGLLVFEPGAFSNEPGLCVLTGGLTWIPVARDDSAFAVFLREVLCVLESPSMPLPGVRCEWCARSSECSF